MIHFVGNPNCIRRNCGNSELLSDVTSLDDFRELCRWRPAVYCCECAEASVALPRTDSDRYAELRKLVEAWQSAKSYDDDVPLQALRDWSHR